MKDICNRRKEEDYKFIRRLLRALHSWIISSSSRSSSKVKLSLSKMVSTCNIIQQINSKINIPIGTYITSKIKLNKSILVPKKQTINIGLSLYTPSQGTPSHSIFFLTSFCSLTCFSFPFWMTQCPHYRCYYLSFFSTKFYNKNNPQIKILLI